MCTSKINEDILQQNMHSGEIMQLVNETGHTRYAIFPYFRICYAIIYP